MDNDKALKGPHQPEHASAMTANEQDELQLAWRRATDNDVRRALIDIDEMLPAAAPIIHAEAARRAIGVAPPQEGIRESDLVRAWRYSWHFLQVHRWIAAFLLGAVTVGIAFSLAPLSAPVHPALQVGFFFLLFLAGDAIACWPLRNFRLVLSCCLAFGAPALGWYGFMLVRLGVTWGWSDRLAFAALFAVAVFWIIPLAMFSIVVWLRRKYQPTFPSGHCQSCGYDLTGLPLPRCPECGTAFVRPGQ